MIFRHIKTRKGMKKPKLRNEAALPTFIGLEVLLKLALEYRNVILKKM